MTMTTGRNRAGIADVLSFSYCPDLKRPPFITSISKLCQGFKLDLCIIKTIEWCQCPRSICRLQRIILW